MPPAHWAPKYADHSPQTNPRYPPRVDYPAHHREIRLMRTGEIQECLQILCAHWNTFHRFPTRGDLARDPTIPRRYPQSLDTFALRQLPSQSVLPPATAYEENVHVVNLTLPRPFVTSPIIHALWPRRRMLRRIPSALGPLTMAVIPMPMLNTWCISVVETLPCF